MNSTAQLARDPQAQLPTGPTHVASRSARTAAPGAWSPTDRWAWPVGLPVSGIARAVAGCIARHANDQTGLGWPGMGTIVSETGFKRTAVIAAIKELERGGHVTVGRFKVGKKNTANRYQLPPMGGAPDALAMGGGGAPDALWGSAPDALPSASDGLGGSAPDGPESVSIESVQEPVSSSRARVVCKICGNDWPASYGTDCHKCRKNPKLSTWTPADDTPTDEPTACTCGDAYRNSYRSKCLDCKGEPSAAQRDALREKHGAGGAHDGWGVDGGGVVLAAGPGIDAPPPETRVSHPDNLVSPEHEIPPDLPRAEPGPNELRWCADFAQWTVGKRPHGDTPLRPP